jgi:hypothetical protein
VEADMGGGAVGSHGEERVDEEDNCGGRQINYGIPKRENLDLFQLGLTVHSRHILICSSAGHAHCAKLRDKPTVKKST